MNGGICPYCRTAIAADDSPVVCDGCGTVHHDDCYAENGGCTIFGCSRAPADEPKISVSAPELVAVGSSAARVEAHEASLRSPPPPPPGSAALLAAQSIPSPQAQEDELRRAANQVVPSIFGGFGAGSVSETLPETSPQPKSRTTYIVLGALLGALGAHSFYAGYRTKGAAQLAITLLSLGFASPMSWIWAVIDICTINEDNHGVQFES